MEARTKKQREALQNHLKQLSNFPSWKIIRDELESISLDLRESILQVDHKKNEKVFTLHDINRKEYEMLQMLIKLPENLFEELEDFAEIEEEA